MQEGLARARREVAAAERREAAMRQAAAAGGGVDMPRAVWEAARAGDAAELRRLLNMEGTLDMRSVTWIDSSPLHAASAAGHAECVQLLCDAGCAVDTTNPGGRTPLYAACVTGHVECAVLLLRLGAAVDAADRWGSTPLVSAAAAGHARCVQLCIEHGANVRARGPQGTAIDVARAADQAECAELLTQHEDVLARGGF